MKRRKPTTNAQLKSHKKILQVLISHEKRLKKLERQDRVVKGFTCAEATTELDVEDIEGTWL